jgi:hypothetical protein
MLEMDDEIAFRQLAEVDLRAIARKLLRRDADAVGDARGAAE